MPDFTCRDVQADECTLVVALHRAAFPPEQVARTIYGAPRTERYLASLLRFPQLQKSHRMFGVWEHTKLIGYAHVRTLDESSHLNNIAVLPSYQGQGIGSWLFKCWEEWTRQMGSRVMSLDVDTQNERACRWYQQQSFETRNIVWNYEKDLQASAVDLHELTLLDWENAEAWQQAFGFSTFRISYGESSWTIGRLGLTHFRVTELIPPTVEGVLAQMDTSRRLLINSTALITDPQVTRVGGTVRMIKPVR